LKLVILTCQQSIAGSNNDSPTLPDVTPDLSLLSHLTSLIANVLEYLLVYIISFIDLFNTCPTLINELNLLI